MEKLPSEGILLPHILHNIFSTKELDETIIVNNCPCSFAKDFENIDENRITVNSTLSCPGAHGCPGNAHYTHEIYYCHNSLQLANVSNYIPFNLSIKRYSPSRKCCVTMLAQLHMSEEQQMGDFLLEWFRSHGYSFQTLLMPHAWQTLFYECWRRFCLFANLPDSTKAKAREAMVAVDMVQKIILLWKKEKTTGFSSFAIKRVFPSVDWWQLKTMLVKDFLSKANTVYYRNTKILGEVHSLFNIKDIYNPETRFGISNHSDEEGDYNTDVLFPEYDLPIKKQKVN